MLIQPLPVENVLIGRVRLTGRLMSGYVYTVYMLYVCVQPTNHWMQSFQVLSFRQCQLHRSRDVALWHWDIWARFHQRISPVAHQLVELVVSTHLKNISQNGNLPQIGVKIKNIWNHHLDLPLVEWSVWFLSAFSSKVTCLLGTWQLESNQEDSLLWLSPTVIHPWSTYNMMLIAKLPNCPTPQLVTNSINLISNAYFPNLGLFSWTCTLIFQTGSVGSVRMLHHPVAGTFSTRSRDPKSKTKTIWVPSLKLT